MTSPTLSRGGTDEIARLYGLQGTPIVQDVAFLAANRVGMFPEAGPHEVAMTPGYMAAHFADLALDLSRAIPDVDFDGLAVIDYEDWALNWERTRNTESADPDPLAHDSDFRDDWEQYLRSVEPDFFAESTPEEAATFIQKTYESAAMDFYLMTMAECQRLRPNAKWGVYNYPPKRYYSNEVPRRVIAYGNGGYLASELNDRLQPLWDMSDALFPSTYCNRVTVADGITPNRALQENNIADDRFYVRSIIREAIRLANGKPVYNVVWARYQNCGDRSNWLINPINIQNQCEESLANGAHGMMWWDGILYRYEANELRTWYQNQALPIMQSTLNMRPLAP